MTDIRRQLALELNRFHLDPAQDRAEQLLTDVQQVVVAAGGTAGQAAALLLGHSGAGDAPELALVGLDPVGIQDTVLASRRFVTRVGASDTLSEWDAAVREKAVGEPALSWAPLYAGGGQAALLAPRRDAPALVQALVRAFAGRLSARSARPGCR